MKNSIQTPNYKVQFASGEGKRRILLGVCRKATLMPSATLKKKKIKQKPFNDSQLFVMLFSVLFYGFKNVSFIQKYTLMQWFPRWHSSKESACQCRRHKRCGFDPWVRKIPWRRKWQPTTVFLPGEFNGQRSLVGYSQTGLSD